MLGCVVMLGLGTLNGWRTGITSGTELDRLTDSVSILLINGFLAGMITVNLPIKYITRTPKINEPVPYFYRELKIINLFWVLMV
jgi:hypothetical protein